MSTSRRNFLRSGVSISSLTAGQLLGAGPLPVASAERDEKRAVGSFDSHWQSIVDSGIYPPRTHLFFDELYIDRMESVRRVVNSPRPVGGGPLLRAEKDWEGVAFVFRNSIVYDTREKRFKFWYACADPRDKGPFGSRSRWAYATSPDGIHWERPELGLVEFKGSTKNNIVSFGDLAQTNALLHNVVHDDRDHDPARRFKAIGVDAHPIRRGEIATTRLGPTMGAGLFAAYSPDGIRWKLREGWLCGQGIVRDGSILHGFDRHLGKWVLWQRATWSADRGLRTIGVSFSEDFERWTLPQYGLVPDDDDPPGLEFDQLASCPSPDGGTIGLLAVSGSSGKGFSAAEEVPQLVYSRDPRVWTRVSRTPFLTLGPAGAWNDGCIIPANPLTLGDEVFLFYYGKNRGLVWGQPTLDGRRQTTSALGLAKLPRDRWLSIFSVGAAGTLTTKLLFFAHDRLHVNADVRGGALRVALLDFKGRPIAGYALADCDPIANDSLNHLVTWKGRSDFAAVIGTAHQWPEASRGLRLRFSLDHAHLYAFSC